MKRVRRKPLSDSVPSARCVPTAPEALLEDCWPYLDTTPEERDLAIQAVCRTAMNLWWSLPEELRERAAWASAWLGRAGEEILRGWAREFREHVFNPSQR